MQCFLQHSTTLLQVHARLKLQQHQQHTPHSTNPSSWLTCTDELSRGVPKIHHFASVSPLRTKALPFSDVVVVVAASYPPKSPDLAVFLPVSAVLLSMYFISNFIVPELITKHFGFDDVNEDQKVDDVNAREDK